MELKIVGGKIVTSKKIFIADIGVTNGKIRAISPKLKQITIKIVDILSDTTRGEGGFGSTNIVIA